MIYPIVVLGVSILITAGLMIFIVPNFKKVFQELLAGEPLPALTQFVMKMSDILKNQIYLVFIAIAVGFVLFKLAKKTKYGSYGMDWARYNMPLVGPIVSKTAIARFGRTLGTLMASGVPVLNALNIVKETSGNAVVSNAIQKVHDAVKEGEGIAPPLGATNIFPQMVISMVEVGEETGKLPNMLEKIADTYEEEVDNAVGALTSMIEPLMMIGLAVVVGGIVVAMFMPMIKIIEKLG
jgi:type IV pilus assembly protein PilC